jgi:hypothetical protein
VRVTIEDFKKEKPNWKQLGFLYMVGWRQLNDALKPAWMLAFMFSNVGLFPRLFPQFNDVDCVFGPQRQHQRIQLSALAPGGWSVPLDHAAPSLGRVRC